MKPVVKNYLSDSDRDKDVIYFIWKNLFHGDSISLSKRKTFLATGVNHKIIELIYKDNNTLVEYVKKNRRRGSLIYDKK